MAPPLLPQVEEFKYPGVLFTRNGEIGRCCSEEKTECETEAIDLLVSLPACPHLCLQALGSGKKKRSWIQTTEMSSLCSC